VQLKIFCRVKLISTKIEKISYSKILDIRSFIYFNRDRQPLRELLAGNPKSRRACGARVERGPEPP
jgi:hypothetical protein